MNKQSPDKFTSTISKPDDFMTFWRNVEEEASKVPPDFQVEYSFSHSSNDVDVYHVFYTSLDWVKVSGWYCVPKQKREETPAILLLPGYNMDPPIPKLWARRGYCSFTAAPRGKIWSTDQFNPGYPGLLTHNIVDKHTYSYRGFYADTWRAFDFLSSRDEVNPERIGVTGNSQGGGLTITTAAMRPQVRAASVGVPYLCGFMDSIRLTSTYPYQEISDYLDLFPDRTESVENTLAYFDGINFAESITCPIIVNAGLQDNVCPPETAYVLFRALGSTNKLLYAYDGHGHDGGSLTHASIVEKFFYTHLMCP